MRTLYTLLLLSCGAIVSAQTVTIRKVELAGDKIIVNYDLEDNNPNNAYLLNLYTSKDNFAAAVTKIKGDVGMDIKPGAGKRMEWSIMEEFGGYKGKLALEVRGKVYVPFVRIQDFDTKKTYRRGKSYDIKWKAGNANAVNIELYNGGQRISGEVNQPNNGNHTLYIPPHAKSGNAYRLKMTDSKNSEEVIYTGNFKVGPKFPIWMKAVPVVVVGVVAVILLQKPDKPETGNNNNNGTEIPTPNVP